MFPQKSFSQYHKDFSRPETGYNPNLEIFLQISLRKHAIYPITLVSQKNAALILPDNTPVLDIHSSQTAAERQSVKTPETLAPYSIHTQPSNQPLGASLSPPNPPMSICHTRFRALALILPTPASSWRESKAAARFSGEKWQRRR